METEIALLIIGIVVFLGIVLLWFFAGARED